MTQSKFHPLLPPYLDQGSSGAAVNAVIHVIMATNWEDIPSGNLNLNSLADKLLPDGDYGTNLAKFVEEVQILAKQDVDGNLGPNTRRYLRDNFQVDLDKLVGTASDTTRFVAPHGVFDYTPGSEPVRAMELV